MIIGQKNLYQVHSGVRTGCHYLINLSVCVCVTSVVFTGCESCTRPISTNPGSMEAGEYGLTRGTCFVARRLEVVAVAGLMRVSRYVFGGARFFRFFHEFVFPNSYAQSSNHRLGEGALTASQSAQPRTRAHLSPLDIPFIVLPPEKYVVIS